jgi:hypothetical protein
MRARNALHLVGISALCLGGIALGSVLHLPAMAAQVYQQYLSPDTTCTSSSPCTTTTNNGSGAASANTSVGGTGLTGTTKFNSTSKTKFAVGVLGSDTSTKGKFNFGVEGTSVSGTGAQGTTKSGIGVSGIATTGFGVSGVSTSGVGVSGTSTIGTGVFARGVNFGAQAESSGTGGTALEAIANGGASNGTGVLAFAEGTGGVGVSANGASFGLLANGPTAVQAVSGTSGTSVEADSSGALLYTGFSSGTLEFFVDQIGNVITSGSVAGASADFDSQGTVPALRAQSFDSAIEAFSQDSSSGNGVIVAHSTGQPLFEGIVNNTPLLVADGVGNLSISGLLFTNGPCGNGCIAHGPSQKRVVSYAPRESQPTMEDVGEGQLVNGEAHVPLDPAFANVIDQNANYFVFMTPDGDCNGLFIAGKSKTGFVVRELRGGHSTLGFEYRIVAKPYGDHSPRLPMITVRSLVMPNVTHTMPHLKPAQRVH